MVEYIESNVPLLLTATIAALAVLYIFMDRRLIRLEREMFWIELSSRSYDGRILNIKFRLEKVEKEVFPVIIEEPEDQGTSCSGCIGGDKLDEFPPSGDFLGQENKEKQENA